MDFDPEEESELAKRVRQERVQPEGLEGTNRYAIPRSLLKFLQENVTHTYPETIIFEGKEVKALGYNGDFYIPR